MIGVVFKRPRGFKMASNSLIRTLYFIGFLDMCGVSMIIGIIIQAFRARGMSPSLTGLVGSVYGATQIFSGPVIGRLGDVYDRKTFLILSYIMPALGYIIIGSTSSFTLIILSRFINGIFKQGQLCSKAYITEQVPSEQHSTTLGHFNAFSSLGFIIGPLVGGHLAEIDPQLRLPFIAAGAIFISASVIILILIPSSAVMTKKRPSSLSWLSVLSSLNMFHGFQLSDHYDNLLFRFVSSLSVITYRRNFSIFLQEVHGMGKYGTIGLITSFNAIVGVVASSFAGRVSKFYRNQLTILSHMTILMCLAMFCSVLLPWLPITVICLVPLSIATSNLRIASVKVMLSRGDEDQRGALIGIGASVSSLARAVSPTLVGVAQEYGSLYSSYMSGGLGLMSLVLAFYVY